MAAPAPAARREGLAVLAAVVLVWAALYLPQLSQGQVFVRGDAGAYRPFAEFSRARWRALHQRTYWNPYTVLGCESVASLADSRPQYLPAPLLDLADRFAEPPASPQLWLLLAHLASAIAVLLLARRLWSSSWRSALCASLAWLLAVPVVLPFTFGHDAQLVSDALFPVAMLAGLLVIDARSERASAAAALAVALTIALTLLHGHPQLTVYALACTALFGLHRAMAMRRPRRAATLAAACALGVAAGAAIWLPALRYGAGSFRGSGGATALSTAEITRYSLAWRDVAAWVWPSAVGYAGDSYWGGLVRTDYSPFLGLVACTLAVLGATSRGPGPSAARFLALAAGVAAIVSMGASLGPLEPIVRRLVPFGGEFRVPWYALVVTSLAVALLAARGALWLERESGFASGTLRAALALAALALVAGLALRLGLAGGFYGDAVSRARALLPADAVLAIQRRAGADLAARAALVLAVLAGGGALLRRTRHGAAVPALLALAIVLDQGSLALPAARAASGPPASREAPRPTLLARVASRDPLTRAYVGVAAPMPPGFLEGSTNAWIVWRALCVTGLAAFPREEWRTAIRHDLLRHRAVLRALAVRVLDLPAGVALDSTLYSPVGADSLVRVDALRDALPRAYAARAVLAAPDRDAAAAAMASPGFDPQQAALVTDAIAEGPRPGSAGCAIRWLADEPEHLALETSADGPAFVIVADSFSPGWSAAIDGRPATIHPTDVLLRGLDLPPGRHTVTMDYRTPGLAVGLALTRAALALIVLGSLVLAVAGWRSRAARAQR